jgi:hypothetical protein
LSWWGGASAWAAPIKVAVVGGYTVHSDAYQAINREMQPPGMQEYPLLLQHMLGANYDVRNFGDCCASVLQMYTPAETHPYIKGPIAGRGPGFPDSLAFLPDIVVIGSWGRHDWGQKTVPSEMFTVPTFQADLDDLVTRYQALSSHPLIFLSLPIPIPFGEATPGAPYKVATSMVVPAFQAVAAKYHLPIIDLYQPFLGHKELFIQSGSEGEGEHIINPAGLNIEAQQTYDRMMAYFDGGVVEGGAGDDAGSPAEDAGAPTDASVMGTGPAETGTSPTSGSTSGSSSSGASATGTGSTGSSSGSTSSPPSTGSTAGNGNSPTGTGGTSPAPTSNSGGCSTVGGLGAAGGVGAGLAAAVALALTARRRNRRAHRPSA